jgi:hypothetical protein
VADEALPAGYIEAGTAYLEALRNLRFEPDGLLWARDKTIDQFVLLLVTRHFDYAGPLEIFRLLTRAYNLSATPKEISPFIIRLHSPDQAIIRNMLIIDAHMPSGERSMTMTASGAIVDIKYINIWVYKWPPTVHTKKKGPKQSAVARTREFRRFKESVERLAA